MNHFPKVSHPTLRSWWSNSSRITASDLMLPLFVVSEDECQPIGSMPGVSRIGVPQLKDYLAPLVSQGLSSVLVFGVVEEAAKDARASIADSPEGPVVQAVKVIKEHFPSLLVACDVCMCDYSSNGHCGFTYPDGRICLEMSVERIAEMCVGYAAAGADVVAPSDMMDNRVAAIKEALRTAGHTSTAIMSYSTKFASAMYGPFREACQSAPRFGDRKCYQLPPGGGRLGALTAERDVEEGADIVMVKPAQMYMDVVRGVREALPNHLLATYQVSGEYVMVHEYATKSGRYRAVVEEAVCGLRRAGADIIISYFTPQLLQWLSESSGVLSV